MDKKTSEYLTLFEHLQDDLNIDRTSLAVECLKQSMLYMRYAEATAYFQKQMQEAKELAKVQEATIRTLVTDNPKAYLGEGVKVTNDRINDYALLHDDYKAARQEAIDAEYRYTLAQQALFAFQQRKAALEQLVALMSMDYFGDIKVETQNTIDEIKQNAQNTLNKRISDVRKKS